MVTVALFAHSFSHGGMLCAGELFQADQSVLVRRLIRYGASILLHNRMDPRTLTCIENKSAWGDGGGPEGAIIHGTTSLNTALSLPGPRETF